MESPEVFARLTPGAFPPHPASEESAAGPQPAPRRRIPHHRVGGGDQGLPSGQGRPSLGGREGSLGRVFASQLVSGAPYIFFSPSPCSSSPSLQVTLGSMDWGSFWPSSFSCQQPFWPRCITSPCFAVKALEGTSPGIPLLRRRGPQWPSRSARSPRSSSRRVPAGSSAPLFGTQESCPEKGPRGVFNRSRGAGNYA